MNNLTNTIKVYDPSVQTKIENIRFAKTNLGPYNVSTIRKTMGNTKIFETIIQSTSPVAADVNLDGYLVTCKTEKLALIQHIDAINYVQNSTREGL